MKKQIFGLYCLLLSAWAVAQTKTYVPDSSAIVQAKIEAWRDLKFGLLMHWGSYSQWGIVESWSICPEDLSWATGGRKAQYKDSSYQAYVQAYEGLKKTFNPTDFSPEKWAAAAKAAGMKYVVFTTKHHDGFCMFDSKYTDYKITDKACAFGQHPKSNVTKEIFSAFRQAGLWVGAYFSKPDWHSDDYWWSRFPASDRNANYSIAKYPAKWQKFVDYTHHQIEELNTDYGKLDILWLDGGWVRPKTTEEITKTLLEVEEGSRWSRNPQSQDIQMPTLVEKLRSTNKDLIVVDREVPGKYQNYLTPEQHIPAEGLPYPWETCMTMATSWSYVPNDVYKPSKDLVEKLVDIVSKGGNFLLNIGPSPTGTLDSAAYSRLHDLGQWMNVHGKAIYNTRMHSSFGEGATIRYTAAKDGKTVYVFVFNQPKDGLIQLTKVATTANTKITSMQTGKKLLYTTNAGTVSIKTQPTDWEQHGWVSVFSIHL